MVTVIRALHLGPTATTAKTAEQMAIANLFIGGVIGGGILFVVLRAMRRSYGLTLGLTLGFVLGLPAELISLQTSESASVGPGAHAVWVLCAFLVWGAVLSRAEQRLIGSERITDAVADSAVERITGDASW